MESRRLKNIIILILALLNLCLLGSLAIRINAEHASHRQAREQFGRLCFPPLACHWIRQAHLR